MKFTHGSKCEAAWGGHVIEHCSACCLTFGSTLAGNMHRTGEHGVKEGPDRRRRLTVEEMEAKLVKRGPLAGQSWFTTRVNKYGTIIWVQRRAEKASWFFCGDDTEARGGAAVGDRLGVA